MATSQSVLHHDVLLSNYVQRWKPPQDVPWYMHEKLFPVVPVNKASNAYKIINQSSFMQTAKAVVGPRGDVATVQHYYDAEGNYKAVPYAIEGVIDHLERDEADDVALYEQLVTDLPMVTLKNSLEIDAYSVLFTTANLGSNYETTPSDQMFDNYGSITSNPMLYIRQRCEKIMNVTGRKVNFLAFDRLVWRALQLNPAVLSFVAVHAVGEPLQLLTVEMFEKKLIDVLEPGSLNICHFRFDPNRGPSTQANLSPRSGIRNNMVIARLDPASRDDISAAKQFAFTGTTDVLGGNSLATAGQAGQSLPLPANVASAPISAFTYPVYTGQRGGTGVRVLTNRAFAITRSTSLWVSLGVVDNTNSVLYGNELSVPA